MARRIGNTSLNQSAWVFLAWCCGEGREAGVQRWRGGLVIVLFFLFGSCRFGVCRESKSSKGSGETPDQLVSTLRSCARCNLVRPVCGSVGNQARRGGAKRVRSFVRSCIRACVSRARRDSCSHMSFAGAGVPSCFLRTELVGYVSGTSRQAATLPRQRPRCFDQLNTNEQRTKPSARF